MTDEEIEAALRGAYRTGWEDYKERAVSMARAKASVPDVGPFAELADDLEELPLPEGQG